MNTIVAQNYVGQIFRSRRRVDIYCKIEKLCEKNERKKVGCPRKGFNDSIG